MPVTARLVRISLILGFFASLFLPIARAQVVTGTPPFGSFGGGPDVINLANLNSHITIPILHKPGREPTSPTTLATTRLSGNPHCLAAHNPGSKRPTGDSLGRRRSSPESFC